MSRPGFRVAAALVVLAGVLAGHGGAPNAQAQSGDEWVCGAYDQSRKRGVVPDTDGMGKTYPVVTIHGITGSDQDFEDDIDLSYAGTTLNPPRTLMDLFAGAKGGADLPTPLEGAHVYSFSYTPDSLRWITHDRVGGAFARTVDCLYERHGVPLVVVGHSMGGLVTRWVANTLDDDGNPRADKIGKVVTLGTPYDGSHVAEYVSAVGAGAGDAATLAPGANSIAKFFIGRALAWCGESGTTTGSGACGPLSTLASEDGQHLRTGSDALTALESWPGTDVLAIAGQIRIQTYVFQAKALTVDLGDFIVSTPSATHDARSRQTFVCEYDLGNSQERRWKRLTLSYGPDERRSELANSFGSPCYHSNLMRNVEVTNWVVGEVADWISEQLAQQGGGWLLAPGRVGQFYVGMPASEGIAMGIVEEAPPNEPCDVRYRATGVPPDVDMYTDFRSGDPERLDDILVKGTTPRTAEGVGVGTPIAQLSAAYGERLIEIEPAPEWVVEYASVVLGSEGAMVFMSYDGVAVTSVSLAAGTTAEEATGHLTFGC